MTPFIQHLLKVANGNLAEAFVMMTESGPIDAQTAVAFADAVAAMERLTRHCQTYSEQSYSERQSDAFERDAEQFAGLVGNERP